MSPNETIRTENFERVISRTAAYSREFKNKNTKVETLEIGNKVLIKN